MAMVNVVTIAAYRRIYWLRLIGLVQRAAATWRWCCSRQMNPVNSRTGYYYYYCWMQWKFLLGDCALVDCRRWYLCRLWPAAAATRRCCRPSTCRCSKSSAGLQLTNTRTTTTRTRTRVELSVSSRCWRICWSRLTAGRDDGAATRPSASSQGLLDSLFTRAVLAYKAWKHFVVSGNMARK